MQHKPSPPWDMTDGILLGAQTSQEKEGRAKQFTCPGVLDVAIDRQSDHSDPQVLLGSSIIISREVVMSQQQDPASLIHLESNSRQHKSLLKEAAFMGEACLGPGVLSHPPQGLLIRNSAGR